eukprot:CAMPEP_0116031636 /NCGR_PEP_ID=MMETSP0321-20121206/17678_1 /TAXON_ID=163516 /ORGANISM="Leptocylindrus danicus var. danicus, Strain B650" /LENGTH=473 /DNA_ID=CAMNT_0003506891 /DNA_START=68 /DNA_END=1485 /DNA_ORIENTATION=+
MGNAESSSPTTPAPVTNLNPGNTARSRSRRAAGVTNVNGTIKFEANDDTSPLVGDRGMHMNGGAAGMSADIEAPVTAPIEITTQKDLLPLLEKRSQILSSNEESSSSSVTRKRKNAADIIDCKQHEIDAPRIDKSYYVYSNVASVKGKRTCLGVIKNFLMYQLSDRQKAIVLVTLCFMIIAGFIGFSSSRSSASDRITDFSDVHSSMDLKLGSIHHWCLFGGDSDCTCENPLDPDNIPDHGNLEKWSTVHSANKDATAEYVSTVSSQDLVFLGSSTVEGWNGTMKGKTRPRLEKPKKIFEELFTRENGGPIDALALGSYGDTSSNLLYRLLHGEMPEYLNPKIWWLVIGTDDLRVKHCSEEVVIMGIIRNVEEILYQKPGAKIVINGLFPTADNERGILNKYWRPTQTINRELRKFAEKHERVDFVDHGRMFVDRDTIGSKTQKVNLEMTEDGVHLNSVGYRMWGEAVQLKAV